MEEDLKWVIGIATTVLVAMIGLIIAGFRHLAAKISGSSGELHSRIDDVKEKYVRRDDFEASVARIESSLREVRQDIKDGDQRILDAITNQRPRA